MKRKYHRYTKAQMQAQLRKIEKLLTSGRMTASALMRKTRLTKKALHHRLRILRNDGKVRYDQADSTVFWSLGSMRALEAKPKASRPASETMLRWGGWAA